MAKHSFNLECIRESVGFILSKYILLIIQLIASTDGLLSLNEKYFKDG